MPNPPNPQHPEWGPLWLPREIAGLMYDAGWTDANRLCVGVAVMLAESNGYQNRVAVNPDGSRDRGIFAINDKAHPDIPDDRCFNPAEAVISARWIYNTAKDFTPWAAYDNGQWKNAGALSYAYDAVGNMLRVKHGVLTNPVWP